MLEREGPKFLEYSEDPSKGISSEKIRIGSEDESIIVVHERLIEDKGFYRKRNFGEDKGLCNFLVFYPFDKRTFIEYGCPWYSPEEKGSVDVLLVSVNQAAEELGEVRYDENGFLFEAHIYPLVSRYQKFDRALREEGIDLDSEGGSERADRLMELTTSGSLRVLPFKGKKFFLKGILQEHPEETIDVGVANSGEVFFWDEYYYRMTEEGNRVIIEVFSGTKERALKKRLVFPLKIKDYEQVFKLFTEDDADWRKIPELIPVEVNFPASA